MREIYAILDTVANALVGTIFIHRVDAAAIRMFGDIASRNDTIVGMHPRDFHLVTLGRLTDDNQIIAAPRVILTGDAWVAAQTPRLVNDAPDYDGYVSDDELREPDDELREPAHQQQTRQGQKAPPTTPNKREA